MTHRLYWTLLLCGGVTTAACSGEQFFECPGVSIPGIQVEVRDAATGQPAALGALGTARSRDTTYRLEGPTGAPDTLLMVGVWNRAGTFDVSINKQGYTQWNVFNVLVESTGGACPFPITVGLQADLQPSP
jgi:hypothetical protein